MKRDIHGDAITWANYAPHAHPAEAARISRQKAGFIQGSTNRTQNFYGIMVVARITLGPGAPETTIGDADLFPPDSDDLLCATLKASRPALQGLY